MRLFLFLLVIAAAVFLLLATQSGNLDQDASLLLPFTQLSVSGPIIAWIAGSLGVGFLLGYLAALPGRFGAAARARRAEKQLEQVQTTTATSVSAARADAATARADAFSAKTRAAEAQHDAAETQRLSDEVARGMANRDVPPPRSI